MKQECPVCGKAFFVDWPSMWVFKRDGKFICSYSCANKYDDRKEAEQMRKSMKITDEQRAEALEMALNGENPLPYLKKIGVANPTATWKTLRAWAEKHWDSDIVDNLPESFGRTRGKKQEEPKVVLVFDESIAEEYRTEQEAKKGAEIPKKMIEDAAEVKSNEPYGGTTPEEVFGKYMGEERPIRPEKGRIINGVDADDVQVTAIRTPVGDFHFDTKYGTIDWRAEVNGKEIGEEISMVPEDWEKLGREIPRMLKILGAED